MPRRSLISQFPEELRAELDERLIQESFANYVALANWLSSRGYAISKSSIQKYGQKFQKQLEAIKLATNQAKSISETIGDDENHLGEALSRLAQQKVFHALVDLEIENDKDVNLIGLVRAIADLNRSSVTVKKYRMEVRDKAIAAAAVVKEKLKGGLSEETIREVEEQILGIAR